MGKFEVHIENEFPFSGCAKCKFMDAQISKTDLYSNDEIYIRNLYTYCRNEDICKNAVEMSKKENDQ